MNDDLISRQAAIAVADSSDYVGLSVDDVKKVTDEVVKGLKRLPSIDAVKHGRWIRLGDNSYKCSECGEVSCCFANYCPDCGARMDGEEEGAKL